MSCVRINGSTRWRTQADFEAWVSSPAFQHGHRGHTVGPVGTGTELWSFEAVQHEEAPDTRAGA